VVFVPDPAETRAAGDRTAEVRALLKLRANAREGWALGTFKARLRYSLEWVLFYQGQRREETVPLARSVSSLPQAWSLAWDASIPFSEPGPSAREDASGPSREGNWGTPKRLGFSPGRGSVR